MKHDLLLTFNAGSSTVKFGLFRLEAGSEGPVLHRSGQGVIDFRHQPLRLHLSDGERSSDIELKAALTEDLHGVLDETLDWFAKHFAFGALIGTGHRVVHGGDRFGAPALIDEDSLAAIEALIPLAPLHQPQSVRLIKAIRKLRPHLRQSASFDTAFHRTQSDVVRRLALPRTLFDEGIKRYGFHGLSYRFITHRLRQLAPELAEARVIAAHLGSGASLCALEKGISRDTSMGFSTLDGVPMATRCGALDAGVLLHLLGQRKMTLEALEDLLYHQSGLLGISGISADSRELLKNDAPAAREALAIFALRIAGEISRMATTLGGLDGIVFTAGIGEHQPEVRAAVCAQLSWLGVGLDPALNTASTGAAGLISRSDSRIAVHVIPTDEEYIIAEEALAVLGHKA